MVRSVLMKGLEALGVEALVTAERQGILEEVLDCFGDVDLVDFRDTWPRWCRLTSCMRAGAGRRWAWSRRRSRRPASSR
jgi:hypothetical protein